MKFHYEVRLEDIVQYYIHMSHTSPQFRFVVKGRQVRFFIVLLLLGAAGFFVWPPSNWLIYYGIWIILSFLLSKGYSFFIYRWIGRRLRKFHAKGKNEGVYGEKKIEINQNGITEQTDGMKDITYQWSAVKEVYVTALYVFIHVSEFTAIMIPRRIFEDKEAWEDFQSDLKDYQGKERGGR
mgnify:FL=1